MAEFWMGYQKAFVTGLFFKNVTKMAENGHKMLNTIKIGLFRPKMT